MHAPAVPDWTISGPLGRGVAGRLPLPWLLALTAGVAATGLLPAAPGQVAVLGAVILLGVPHGALDGEVARPMLRPRFGRGWFPVFAMPYLALSALVLLSWYLMPGATMAGFLAVSAWHFGTEDAGTEDGLAMVVRGGLPIALPVLLHPAATAQFLSAVSLAPMPAIPAWLALPALGWMVLALAFVAVRRDGSVLREMAGLTLAFALLPPLAGFAIYFIGFHAPRHVTALVENPWQAPRVRTMRQAVLRSLPVTGLTLLLGALLWPLYPGLPADRLLTVTLQGLAALTLPHLLLGWLASRRLERQHHV